MNRESTNASSCCTALSPTFLKATAHPLNHVAESNCTHDNSPTLLNATAHMTMLRSSGGVRVRRATSRPTPNPTTMLHRQGWGAWGAWARHS